MPRYLRCPPAVALALFAFVALTTSNGPATAAIAPVPEADGLACKGRAARHRPLRPGRAAVSRPPRRGSPRLERGPVGADAGAAAARDGPARTAPTACCAAAAGALARGAGRGRARAAGAAGLRARCEGACNRSARGGGLLPRERALDYAFRFARDDEAARRLAHARRARGRPRTPARLPTCSPPDAWRTTAWTTRAPNRCSPRALAAAPAPAAPGVGRQHCRARRALALTGLALVKQKRRDWDGSLATLREALGSDGTAEVLMALTETLIRLGRTDEAISAAEWAVRLAPYNDAAHYLLGNGYARKNYTQLFAAYPAAFADAAGRARHRARRRAARRRAGATRRARRTRPSSPRIPAGPTRACGSPRSTSRTAASREARDGCFAALAACPEYGRAHAVLAKALEAQRFAVDVHRAGYEARFAATPMPEVPGIERFVANWKSLSPRHQKRVALSIAPWKAFVPVLVDGGATYFIKPIYMLLSECPAQETLRDQRISYDSRLWDDVRGCGGYHTVTGIEDVERTIFDRYNTVLHELTHQVHAVLPADDSRAIQEHYRRAKERDDAHEGRLPVALRRAAACSSTSPRAPTRSTRPCATPTTRARWCASGSTASIPALRTLVEGFMARTDVSASYPIAYAAGGDDRVERGRVAEALPLYRKALARDSTNETALIALSRALVLGGQAAAGVLASRRAPWRRTRRAARRASRSADASWHTARGRAAARASWLAARADACAPRTATSWIWRSARLAWAAGDAPALARGVRLGARVPVRQPGGPAGPRRGAGAGRPQRRGDRAVRRRRCACARASWSCAAPTRATCCVAGTHGGRARATGRRAAARRAEPAPPRRCARGPSSPTARTAERARAREAGARVGAVVRPRADRLGRHRAARGQRRRGDRGVGYGGTPDRIGPAPFVGLPAQARRVGARARVAGGGAERAGEVSRRTLTAGATALEATSGSGSVRGDRGAATVVTVASPDVRPSSHQVTHDHAVHHRGHDPVHRRPRENASRPPHRPVVS